MYFSAGNIYSTVLWIAKSAKQSEQRKYLKYHKNCKTRWWSRIQKKTSIILRFRSILALFIFGKYYFKRMVLIWSFQMRLVRLTSWDLLRSGLESPVSKAATRRGHQLHGGGKGQRWVERIYHYRGLYITTVDFMSPHISPNISPQWLLQLDITTSESFTVLSFSTPESFTLVSTSSRSSYGIGWRSLEHL